jgi:hypothetical protein
MMSGEKVFQDMVDQITAREDYLDMQGDDALIVESDDYWLASDCMPATGPQEYEDYEEQF